MQAADDVANGLADSLLAEAPVGAELTSVALFIDEESAQARCMLPRCKWQSSEVMYRNYLHSWHTQTCDIRKVYDRTMAR